MKKVRYATLARDVLDAAAAGDVVAAAIVDQQAMLFARYAVAAAEKVDLLEPEIPVVLGGSVLSSESPALRDATRTALAELLPAARATPALPGHRWSARSSRRWPKAVASTPTSSTG